MRDSPTFLILGAGPSGSALAAYLARAGEDVLVVDQRETPIDTVGESLIPQGNRVLAELGVSLDDAVEKHGAVFTRGDAAVRFAFDEAVRGQWTVARQVRRSLLDQRLRDAARDAGARFLYTTVRDPGPETVQTDAGPLRAEWVVDCLGRRQVLARKLGIREQHDTLRNAAVGAVFEGVAVLPPEHPGDIVIAAFDGGWCWVIPLGGGQSSVGAVTTPSSGIKGRFDEAIARCPAVRRRLEGARRVSEFRGHQDFTSSAARFSGAGWALCGDAAVFVDPIFSSGILLGLEGAAGLAAALATGELDAWEQRIRAASSTFEAATLAFYDGSFLDVAFSDRSRQTENIRQTIVSLLAGDVFDADFTGPSRIARRFARLARMVS